MSDNTMSNETISVKTFQTAMQHYGYVMGLAVRFAPFPGLAGDIVQDVFVEFAKESEHHENTDITSLLYRLTQRVAKRHYRDRLHHSSKELREIAEILAEKGNNVLDEPKYEAELVAMRECLERLPGKSREIVQRHYFNNETLEEIARRKNIRSGTLRQFMTRIRRNLKECVKLRLRTLSFPTEQH